MSNLRLEEVWGLQPWNPCACPPSSLCLHPAPRALLERAHVWTRTRAATHRGGPRGSGGRAEKGQPVLSSFRESLCESQTRRREPGSLQSTHFHAAVRGPPALLGQTTAPKPLLPPNNVSSKGMHFPEGP